MTPRRSRSGEDAPIVDPVGGSLLIRTGRDPASALTAMSRVLRPQPGWTYVVCAPSVTARQDCVTILAEVIGDRVVDPDVEVCLVLLGSTTDRSTVESKLQSLAQLTGRPILVPLGPVTVSSDGSMAVAAGHEARGGWATYFPGRSPRYHAAWIPLPEWGKSLAPEAARVAVRGAMVVHPVPAGFWVLPTSEGPGHAGPAAAVAPQPTTMTIFVGGSTAPPAPFDTVVEALSAIPMAEHCRVVLLPRALAPDGGVAELRALCGPSIALQAAVPIWSDAAWSLAQVSPRGRLGHPAPMAGSPWYDREPPGPRRRYPAPAPVPLPGRHRLRRSRVDPKPLPGAPTPAGWSFLTSARPIGVVRAAAGTVIEVDASPAGFVLHGKSIAADALAGLMAAACPSRPGAVIVVAHGSVPTASGRPAFAQLAEHLGRDVIVADADVSMSPFGVLYTAGSFHLCPAGLATEGPPSTRTLTLGDILPGWPSASAPRSDGPPASGQVSRPGVPPIAATGGDPAPDSGPERPVATTRPVSSYVPVQIAAANGDEYDRHRLRQVLDGRYDDHEQAVTRLLTDDPNVSRIQTSTVAIVGLVAVRSYCSGGRDVVNQVLRGEANTEQGDPATVIASCALHGLGQLPVVFGPVFAASQSTVPAGAYQAGLQLVEPAFIDVDLRPIMRSGPGVDYAIWSIGARRLGALGSLATSGRSTAVFPPGTRFLVLGTDLNQERQRILLLSLSQTPAGSDWDADIAEVAPVNGLPLPGVVRRLRATMAGAPGDGRGPSRSGDDFGLRFPIGLDPLGLPYRLTGWGTKPPPRSGAPLARAGSPQ